MGFTRTGAALAAWVVWSLGSVAAAQVIQPADPGTSGTGTGTGDATATGAGSDVSGTGTGGTVVVQQQPAGGGYVGAGQGAPLPPVDEEPEEYASNSIFLEGLGSGLWYSLNYERLILNMLGVRIGFGYVPLSVPGATAHYLTIPLELNYLGIRAGSHVFEMGAGATLAIASATISGGGLIGSASGFGALGTAHLGWRIHPIRGGFHFRIGAELLYGPGLPIGNNATLTDWGVLPWGYLSLGGVF